MNSPLHSSPPPQVPPAVCPWRLLSLPPATGFSEALAASLSSLSRAWPAGASHPPGLGLSEGRCTALPPATVQDTPEELQREPGSWQPQCAGGGLS